MKFFKLSLLLLIVLTFSVDCPAQPLTLLSWNLKDLGNSRDATEIRVIAETVRNADIIAIQEVVAGDGGAQAVARLVTELNTMGAAWDYVVSNPTLSSSYKTERYAFIWKKSRVKLVGKPWLQQGEYAQLIDREPYFATFEASGKQITVVNFHAITRAKQPETEVKYFKFLPALYPGLKLVFAGDFNLPQSHSVFNPLKGMGYLPALVNQKTSLRQKCLEDGCLASEFDNIFYKPEHLKVSEKGIIHFYEKVETFEKARLISDHVPVYIRFMIN
jgi:endonuclease/exonuclease/phosphatase family metal-dependent hydrolase